MERVKRSFFCLLRGVSFILKRAKRRERGERLLLYNKGLKRGLKYKIKDTSPLNNKVARHFPCLFIANNACFSTSVLNKDVPPSIYVREGRTFTSESFYK